MPHLHDNNEAEEKVEAGHGKGVSTTPPSNGNSTSGKTNISLRNSAEIMIREAREGYLGASGSTTTSANSSKTPSFESTEEERTPEDTSSTPRPHGPKKTITPSPYGAPNHRSGSPERRYGPMLSIYGNTRLFPSPIRVKKRTSSGSVEEHDPTRNSSSPQMKQPSNLRYAGMYVGVTPPPPPHPQPPKEVTTTTSSTRRGEDRITPFKRPVEQIEFAEAVKKARSELESPDCTPSRSNGDSHTEASQESGERESHSSRKKRIISPTSSGERGEDDESTGAPRNGSFPYPGRPYPSSYPVPPYSSPSHPHHMPPYGMPPPPFGAGYPMYNGYPPPPYMNGHAPGAHPPPFYPPYPPHHPHMMLHYRPHSKYPTPYPGAGTPHRGMSKGMGPADESAGKGSSPSSGGYSPQSPETDRNGNAIKSVAEWQRAAITTGKPPSANRCVPLKEPIPSKYWGEAEKTKDVVLPDFHRLVNYPDYLAKSRSNSSSSDAGSAQNGRKHCVMCGKLRVCSASSLVGRGSSRGAKADDVSSVQHQQDDDGTAHIIPRQNKGLCTACDVTVWVVAADGLEIKWCKGCKNFRPWAAFGDKGSATKCVRCRDRQREKYAMQKDEIRLRRYKRTSSSSVDSSSSSSRQGCWEGKKEDETHMEAARGLRNLMNATT